jgi:chorismate mutase/prephenate dehydratase
LAQCRRWLRPRGAGGAAFIETSSTAEAVGIVVDYPRLHPASPIQHVAAVGRQEAARRHHLRAVPIPDDRENKTRFLILSRRRQAGGRRRKTSLLVGLKDRPGALYDVLMPFKQEAINLTKIESRPSKRKAWEYAFFIDLAADADAPRVRRALRALRATTTFLRVLGVYPAVRARR